MNSPRESTIQRKIEPMAFSVEEAAVYAGLPYATIKRLIKTGKLPASKFGSNIVVRRASVDRLLYDSQMQVSG